MHEIGALESKSPRPPRLRRVQAGAGFLRPQQTRPVAASAAMSLPAFTQQIEQEVDSGR